MKTRTVAVTRTQLVLRTLATQDFSERRWLLFALVTAAVGSTLLTFGRLHSMHSSDSLIPVLVSLQRWTFFYWDQGRFGMLVPFLALPVRDPFTNLLVQGGVNTAAALLMPLLASRWLLGAAERWVTSGILTNVLLVGLAPLHAQFDWFISQPYALSLCLGFAALTIGTASRARAAAAILLMALAHWVNFAAFVLLLPCILAEPRRALRSLGLITLGAITGLLGASLVGSEPGGAILAPIVHWVSSWTTLLSNTQSVIWHRGWLAGAVIGSGCLVALGRYWRRRPSRGVPTMVAIIAALFYWMAIGSTEWVRLNAYNARYIYPSLLMLAVGFTILVVSDGRRDRLGSTLPVVIGLMLVIVLVHRPAQINELKRSLNQRFGQRTTEIVSSGATVVSGDYWTVWPAVFHANMARYRLTGRNDVFGLTYRSKPTLRAWRGRSVLMAVISGDAEGLRNAEQLRLRLRLVEHRSTVSIFIAEPGRTANR